MTDPEQQQKVELFIGALSSSVSQRDLEEEFGKYGKLTRCDLKQRIRDSFAFVAYDNHDNAQKAMDAMQGTTIQGCKINIEWTNSKPRLRGGRREGEEDVRPRGGSSRRFGSSRGRYSPSRYSPYDRSSSSRSSRRYSPRRRDSRERSPRRRYSRERSPRRYSSRSPDRRSSSSSSRRYSPRRRDDRRDERRDDRRRDYEERKRSRTPVRNDKDEKRERSPVKDNDISPRGSDSEDNASR